jgi:hypothetical protein
MRASVFSVAASDGAKQRAQGLDEAVGPFGSMDVQHGLAAPHDGLVVRGEHRRPRRYTAPIGAVSFDTRWHVLRAL